MDEAKKVVLNIVSWNSQRYLPGLFASLDEQDTRDFSVTVVDNASTDGTLEWLQGNRPEVTMLRNFRNQGFARAHNQAIAMALSRWPQETLDRHYILVTNPDLEFAPEALRLLVAYMDGHPEVSACMPKLLRIFVTPGDDEQPEAQRSTTIDSTGLTITKARKVYDRGAGEEDRGQYDQAIDIFGATGACVMFRASHLVRAKLVGEFFDEDIFAYKEDADLAWRMQRLGMHTHFVPHAVIWHHRRAPSAPTAGWFGAWRLRRRKSPFVNYLSSRNHLWMLAKNDEWVNALLHLPWWLPYECAKWFAALLSWSTLKGQVAALIGLPMMLRKRKELAARVQKRGKEIRRWFV